MLFYSRKNRPFELGPYPLERLSHEKSIFAVEAEKPMVPRPKAVENLNANSVPYKMNDFELNDYDPHPAIKAKMNV